MPVAFRRSSSHCRKVRRNAMRLCSTHSGYDWQPMVIGDHSHTSMFVATAEDRVKGTLCSAQNPVTSLTPSWSPKVRDASSG
jgi:hypothetical protein